MTKPQFVSVIFTTYNQPEWLKKVLWGFECQTHKNFELIIADDGSGNETRMIIEEFIRGGLIKIKHIWHPDEGYQKCPILNKAIIAAESDYLIFTDGDCIPRKDFIEQHIKNRETGYFLSGGTIRLPMDLSRKISYEEISEERAFDLGWLYANNLPRSFKSTKLCKNFVYSKLMNWLTPTKASWNGHNSSGWKRDIIAINGFNETMLYGGQDRELGERLHNFGVKSKQIRYSAICIHLEHARPYKTEESIKKNQEIRRKLKLTKAFWTDKGINQYFETIKNHQPIFCSTNTLLSKHNTAI